MLIKSLLLLAELYSATSACGDGDDSYAHNHAKVPTHSPCNESTPSVQHVRNVRRLQPGALDAATTPGRELEWGELNFLHVTDTHGWLTGHLREENYGADWGDFSSFVHHMREKAKKLGVDLLVVDTGDLHHGTALDEPLDHEDTEGKMVNDIFTKVNFDLLTIGNHELYGVREADLTAEFAKKYGENYITTNAQYRASKDDEWQYFGVPYRYFTTENGLRIMALGIIFDDKTTLTAERYRVIFANKLVTSKDFLEAVHFKEEIDIFVVLGHNEINIPREGSTSTLDIVFTAIRKVRPDIPIQFFGGHSHVRMFRVFDNKATGIQSGRFCETVGWLSISGINKKLEAMPKGTLSHPTKKAVSSSEMKRLELPQSQSESDLLYARRYLSWNRPTFAKHAIGSQDMPSFNTKPGLQISEDITDVRKEYKTTEVLGCAPLNYCQFCVSYGSERSVYTLAEKAMNAVVLEPGREKLPRVFIHNTALMRFEIFKGVFTVEDAIAASPLETTYVYLKGVPYDKAIRIIPSSGEHKRDGTEMEMDAGAQYLQARGLDFSPTAVNFDECSSDPPPSPVMAANSSDLETRHDKREIPHMTGNYVKTIDDFGDDGDDIPNEDDITYHPQPNPHERMFTLNIPEKKPDTVDLVTQVWSVKFVLKRLKEEMGEHAWTEESFQPYAQDLNTKTFLLEYAKKHWRPRGFNPQKPHCPA